MLVFISGCSLEFDSQGEVENAPTSAEVENLLKVVFLDVGQGASQLLISPSGKTMLIDAGNNDQEEHMVQYLQQYGVDRLDIVIGTHPDADHIGGLDAVIDHVEVGKVYMPKVSNNTKTFESLLRSIKNKGLKVSSAKAGIKLDWDDQVDVTMLSPILTGLDNNNMSAVVKVTYGDTSFLLTGDAESISEKEMIDSGEDLQADVLLVGHHGSKTSTSLRFLNQVNPKYAVIQVGENSYGHPKETILERLRKKNVEVYRNDLQGTVEFTSDGQNYQISKER
ncbi:ComEC/Rec2 family competence protein [Paenibacillus segetis]|uniref:MBL fold protein n=1 Tax=Paenibacillus segetis TaxID=1325360 RepID=A0ABQ1YIP0_9BACL|nr:ComEC/Rec2 family competence protein [Paenibacillus segetis]GGH26082.1 MBL fold protein [Paenibacillus segetis]